LVVEVEIREPVPGDGLRLAERLRPADRDEVIATLGPVAIGPAIERCLARSQKAWAGWFKGEVVALFGVTAQSLLDGEGSPWMLGTPFFDRHPGALLVQGRRYVAEMRALFPRLVNYVDVRNRRSVRWLARMGFTIGEAVPYGAAGLPFYRFEMGA